jgi:hypothetical protein
VPRKHEGSARSRWEDRLPSEPVSRPYVDAHYRSQVDDVHVPRQRTSEPPLARNEDGEERSESYRTLQRELEELMRLNEGLKDASNFFATQRGPSHRRPRQ